MLEPNRVGTQFVEWLDDTVNNGLWTNVDVVHADDDDCVVGEPVYMWGGDVIKENDWCDYWSQFPDWWEMAYMLAGNGSYDADEVGGMTVEQIREAYNDPETEFENVFFTELEL